MRFGISVPNFGGFGDPRVISDLAREVEDAGWDGFFLWDHINWSSAPMVDPWVALAGVAVATKRIRIGTLVTPLPRRRPWIVARQAVTLDHLSGGRVILGVGLGYPADTEYEALGEEADDRVRAEKLDESLSIIDGLWSGEPFSFEGKHYQITNARFLPRPLQHPRIPIWVAGMLPNRAPLRRAARWDGVFPIRDVQFIGVDDAREVATLIARHRNEDAGAYDIVVGGPLPQDLSERRDKVAAFAAAGATWWIEGDESPEGLRAMLSSGPPLDAG
jgi:alkanesulfonate monooxygenase SsuD/methylene tetrahydromethanopterin reductase-like flavin-dependent oxidoreductase (luciferase family)